MTNLTDKWEKGELPDGEYWCLSICGDIDKLYCYQNRFWKYKTEDDYYGLPVEIEQVLAPVPSYDEWQASEKYNKHLEEKIKIYEQKDKQATETSIAYNELLDENTKLKEQVNHLLKTQARQFVDNQKLQVKAKKAKDVVNIDTARQIKQFKELLKECELWFTGIVGNMNDKNVGEHNRNLPIGNFEHIFKVFLKKSTKY